MPKLKPNKILETLLEGKIQTFLDVNNDAYISFNSCRFIAHKVDSTTANGMLRAAYRSYQKNQAKDDNDIPDLLKRHLDNFNDVFLSEASEQNLSSITHFWVRIGKTDGSYESKTYYDLGDNKNVLEISHLGVEKVSDVPLMFRRSGETQSIQCDYVDTDIQNVYRIFKYINIQDRDSQLLLITYLVSLFDPRVHKYMLYIHGLKGSSKTTTFRVIKSLIDPHNDISNPARDAALPDKPERNDDMFLHTLRHYILYFDNVNNLTKSTQTLLTKMVTGAVPEKRKLYTDSETKKFPNKPALGINGVSQIMSRDELIQRCLILEVDRITERKTEAHFWESFYKKDKQVIFSALCKLYSLTLRSQIVDDVKNVKLPRMSDASKLMLHSALALGFSAEYFMGVLSENIRRQDRESIDYSPTGRGVIAFMDANLNASNDYTWQGSASILHRSIKAMLSVDKSSMSSISQNITRSSIDIEIGRRYDQFPQSLQSFGMRLKEVIENLSNLGYVVDKVRSKRSIEYKLVHYNKQKKDEQYRRIADEQ